MPSPSVLRLMSPARSPNQARSKRTLAAKENSKNGSPPKKAKLRQATLFQTGAVSALLGLVRVPEEDSALPSNPTAIALKAGNTLGRNPKKKPPPSHVDLNITTENGAPVSRTQLMVKEVNASRIVIEQYSSVTNKVMYIKRDGKTTITLKEGTVTLVAGDRLLFPSDKKHAFIVHPLQNRLPTPTKTPTKTPTVARRLNITEATTKPKTPEKPRKVAPAVEPEVGQKTRTLKTRSSRSSQKTYVPTVGHRFRVYYDHGKDFLGGERPQAGGWFFGVCTTVEKMKRSHKVTLHLEDDISEDFDSVKDRLEKVEELKDGRWIVSGTDKVASSPAEDLELGDLVTANYQKETCWYRGRVGKVGTGVCDIAYDDGHYETNIPLSSVRLLERGRENPEWMVGLTAGHKIQSVSGSQVKFGRRKVENYDDVVKRLCSSMPVRAKKVLAWPGSEPSPPASGDSEVTKPYEEEDCPQIAVASSRAPVASAASSRTLVSPIAKTTSSRSLVAPIAKKWRPPPCRLENLEVTGEEHWRQPLPTEPVVEDKRKYTDMHTSLATTFWKALNTAEPHLGSTMLTMLTSAHRELPTETVCKNLIDLLTFGPKSGSDFFPDCNRMTLAITYFTFLLKHGDMVRRLAHSAGPNYWKDCLESLESLRYCLPDDDDVTTDAARLRIGQSLHVQMCATEVFGELLQLLLDEDPNKVDFRSLPILKDIILHGVAPVLKLAINAMTSVGIRHGHYLVGKSTDKDSLDSVDQLTFDVTDRLVNNLGRIVSCLLELWEREQDQPATECAYQIRDAVDRHIQEGPKRDKAYLEQIKIKLVLSLDNDRVREVRDKIAKLFKLGKRFQ